MSTAEKIKQLRLDLDLTQIQFGQLFGVHRMTVYNWERGVRLPIPRFRELVDLGLRAIENDPCTKVSIAENLIFRGHYPAIRVLLDAALGKQECIKLTGLNYL